MAMHVLDRRERATSRRPAPRAPTTEISRSRSTNASRTASPPAERVPGRARVAARLDRHLPLAVVAERGRLEDRRAADAPAPRRTVGLAGNGGERRHRQAVLARETSSRAGDAARSRARGRSAGRSRAPRRPRPRRRPDVLELERHHVHAASRTRGPLDVVVRRVDLDVGDLAGRRVVLGRERVNAVAQTARRHREHAAELTAAEHANGRAGRESTRAVTGAARAGPRRQSRRDTPGACAKIGPRRRQNRNREQARVGRARGADRDRRHRNALRHLHDRQQRIEAVQRRALHRHADHGQHGVRGHHPRQVRRAAGARDDHFQPALRGLASRTRPSTRACGGRRRPGIREAR